MHQSNSNSTRNPNANRNPNEHTPPSQYTNFANTDRNDLSFNQLHCYASDALTENLALKAEVQDLKIEVQNFNGRQLARTNEILERENRDLRWV